MANDVAEIDAADDDGDGSDDAGICIWAACSLIDRRNASMTFRWYGVDAVTDANDDDNDIDGLMFMPLP